MTPDMLSKSLDDAHALLAVYDEVMQQLTTDLTAFHARTKDLEAEVDRARAELGRARAELDRARAEVDRVRAELIKRGERLRALGESVERTEWDRPMGR